VSRSKRGARPTDVKIDIQRHPARQPIIVFEAMTHTFKLDTELIIPDNSG